MQPEDIAGIAAAGYTFIINNRPDEEVPAEQRGEAIAAAARAAGLGYLALPVRPARLDPALIAALAQALQDTAGPVLGYCRSGTRSSTLWSLAQAQSGAMEVDDILSATRAAGYDLDHIRPMLEDMARNAG